MKKALFALLLLACMLLCSTAVAAEKLDDVPQSLIDAYEKQSAIARQQMLNTYDKGAALKSQTKSAGFTDTDVNDGMVFTYKTNWSTAYVGDTIITFFEAYGGEAPYLLGMGYIMYDENFNEIDEFHDYYYASGDIDNMISYVPQRAGYLTFVFVLQDDYGNQIATNTPCVMITWEWRNDPFYTIGFADESAFGLTVYLDKSSVSVGDTVRGTFGSVDTSLRKNVTATWYIVDDYNNVVDSESWSGTEYSFNYYMDYTVNYTGWLYFSVYVEDQYGRDVLVDTTKIKIGGTSAVLSGTASLNKSSVAVGTPVTATYKFINSNGRDEYIEGCWIIIDGEEEYENWIVLDSFSGSVSFTPTFGDSISFYVCAEDSEYHSWYETAYIPITGAATIKPVSVTGSISSQDITRGDRVTLTYTVSDGVTPYEITVGASSYTSDDTFVDSLYYDDSAPASGSFTFTADSGDYVFVYVSVTDAQGFTDLLAYDYLWLSEPSARIPGDVNGDGAVDAYDALRIMQYDAGWDVTLDTANADVDANGTISLSDAVLIFQYDSGMNVTLK